MKKISIILIVLCIGFMFNSNKAKAANEMPNWNFFPLGVNYLSNDYFLMEENSGDYIFEGIEAFRVASDTQYRIKSLDEYNDYIEIEIKIYDSARTLIGTIDATKTSNGEFSFSIPSNVSFIKPTITFYNGNLGQFDGIDSLFIMYESSVNISSLSGNDLLYKGPNTEYSFVTKDDIYYITDVNSPITTEEIEESVRAYDNIGGDLSSRIVFDFNEYNSSKDTVGVYVVTATVTDDNNNTRILNIHIAVCDNEKPVISGNSNITTNISSPITIEEIKRTLVVSDNYDNLTINNIVIESDGYTENRNKVGTSSAVFSVADSSGNKTTFTVTIKVVDDVKPIFTFSQDKLVTGTKTILSVDKIKELTELSAYDEVSGNLTSKIYVEFNEYEKYKTIVGGWKVVFTVVDDAGNSASKEITIVVDDDIKPIFAVDTQVFDLELGSNYTSPSDFVAVLQNLSIISQDAIVEVVYDDYTPNQGKIGKYKMVLKVDDKELKLVINVNESKEEEKIIKNPTFFNKVGTFFVNLWNNVSGFFIRLWDKISSFFVRIWEKLSH